MTTVSNILKYCLPDVLDDSSAHNTCSERSQRHLDLETHAHNALPYRTQPLDPQIVSILIVYPNYGKCIIYSSNMPGRGGVFDKVWDGYVQPECHLNPAILRMNGNSIWEVAQEPLHEDIDLNKTCGIGPTMVFANSLVRSEGRASINNHKVPGSLPSGGPFIEGVREAQLGINILNVITVDALGLPLEPNGLHLSTPAQVQLGYKLPDAIVRALQSLPLHSLHIIQSSRSAHLGGKNDTYGPQ
ncbi:hypothetical protein RND71_001541 [Anisodus tanguticus]|uniref:Sialate O-acetylesterase domain-containing protein n=1 Tax=Anisodus tanguticus TaxID=243964 RepID=A0AAE1SZI1_9SOLA|nr:hypothetical protein RND71_001541 [Anisodus tanguticus]